MKHQIKLFNITDHNLLERFVDHLETMSDKVVFVVCPANDAILLQFEAVYAPQVYYATDLDNCTNNPILAIERDCRATNVLNDWEKDQLYLKSFCKG